jgi:membrane protein DedA with SNARE-associated domain
MYIPYWLFFVIVIGGGLLFIALIRYQAKYTERRTTKRILKFLGKTEDELAEAEDKFSKEHPWDYYNDYD